VGVSVGVSTSHRRPASAQVNPFSREWVQQHLAPLAARARAGEDADALRTQLFEDLWPWAKRIAAASARRLPEHADRAESSSATTLAVYQACMQIDWERYESWPSLMARRIAGARIDAARVDDVLSRRHRIARNAYLRLVSERQQQVGGALSMQECYDLAAQALPPGARADWADHLVRGVQQRHPIDEAAIAVPCRRPGPEERAEEGDTAGAVRDWLDNELPAPLKAKVTAWLAQSRPRKALPAQLRMQLGPYIPALLASVDDGEALAS
jgi:hypothetical protein